MYVATLHILHSCMCMYVHMYVYVHVYVQMHVYNMYIICISTTIQEIFKIKNFVIKVCLHND